MHDWRGLIGNRQLSPEAIDELAQHLEDTYQATLARSGSEVAAMRAVHDELASLGQATTALDIRTPRIGILEQMRQFIQIDLKDALRRLRRSRGFSLLAITVLAVGLGVNTAIFSLINALVFRPLPVRAPDELVFLYFFNGASYSGVPSTVYDELATNNAMFREITGSRSDTAWVTVDGRTEQLTGQAVTGGYFNTLGVAAEIGRTFSANEDAAGAPPSILISHAVWTSRFHSDPAVVGRTLRLSPGVSLTESPGRDYTIIGVLPSGFNGTDSAASWLSPNYYVPAKQRALDAACPQAPGSSWSARPLPLSPVGRLAAGVTFEAASEFVASSNQRWNREWPTLAVGQPSRHFELRRTRLARLPIDSAGEIVPERLATAFIVMSGLLLLIAASNLIGIFMARAVTTRTDTAIRLSLGAGRWRIARQHLTEGYLLSIAGTAAGFVVAGMLTKLFVTHLPPSGFNGFSSAPVPVAVDVPFDGRVLLFAIATCAIVGAIIGLGPARQASTTDVLPTLQLAAATSVRSREGLRHWIVVPQIAVALVLLLVTGAVARTVITTEMTDPGYAPAGLVEVQFELPRPDSCAAKTSNADFGRRRDELARKIHDLLPTLRSSGSAAVSSFLPGGTTLGASLITPESAAMGQHVATKLFDVSPEFFATMKIPIIAGRGFSTLDAQTTTPGEPGAFIVSRRLAENLWPGQNPVGRLLARHSQGATFPSHWTEVVGVADDILSPLHNGYPSPTVYEPIGPDSLANRVVARAQTSEAEAVSEISDLVKSADPSAVVVSTGTLSGRISQIRFGRRLAMVILGSAALIGLALAAIGLYGVVSYALSQRLREFGIRAALGANHRDLIALVFKEALIVASIGSAIGLAAAYCAIGLISSKLVAIPSVNWAIVISGPAIVFTAVALACYFPARRAARVDPLIVLRGL